MIVACKCLNISLQHSAMSSDKATVMALAIKGDSHLAYPNLLKNEYLQFFEKARGLVNGDRSNEVTATTNVPVLVHAETVENWTAFACLHCDCIAFAKSVAGEYLVNPDLLTSLEDIASLKSNASYSPVFGILFNKSAHDTDFTYTNQKSAKIGSVGDADHRNLNELTQQFRATVKREIEATDERILAFTNAQFMQLKAFRERAESDYNLMVRLLRHVVPDGSHNHQHHLVGLSSIGGGAFATNNPLDTPPATPDSTPMSIGNSPNFKPTGLLSLLKQQTTTITATPTSKHHSSPVTPSSPLVPQQQDMRNRNVQFISNNNNRYAVEQAMDASAFCFEMDDVTSSDVTYQPPMFDEEESDSENETGGKTPPIHGNIPIPRRYGGRPKSLSIAQSLPVSIPVSEEQHSLDDEYDEYADADDHVDIAASIKALAKSVHGEALFGDLPRPRFSTQI